MFRWGLPGVAGSYCPSAGGYPLRPTGGRGGAVEQVACGVAVPVEDQAAGGALVGALGQGELGSHRAAARASARFELGGAAVMACVHSRRSGVRSRWPPGTDRILR